MGDSNPAILYRTAVHESGHAVVSAMLGVVVHALVADPGRGGTCYAGLKGERYEDIDADVTILAAGDAAEMLRDAEFESRGRTVARCEVLPSDLIVKTNMPELEGQMAAALLAENEAPTGLRSSDFEQIVRRTQPLRDRGETSLTPHEWYTRGRDRAESILRRCGAELDALADALVARRVLYAADVFNVLEAVDPNWSCRRCWKG